jgi:hypothetical protein
MAQFWSWSDTPTLLYESLTQAVFKNFRLPENLSKKVKDLRFFYIDFPPDFLSASNDWPIPFFYPDNILI